MKMLVNIAFVFLCSLSTLAQKDTKVKVTGDDPSTPGYVLHDIEISTDNTAYLKRYKSAKYFIRRVYAYAELASGMLNEYEQELAALSSNRSKKRYLKKANKELKNEFGDEIREMSVTRGRYLNKLIFRNTGLSTYDIIKHYRGGFQAMFWQSLCKFNGQDLKMTYDPDGDNVDDIVIERVIREIEEGKIKVIPRMAKSEKGKEIEKKNKKKKGMRWFKKDREVASR